MCLRAWAGLLIDIVGYGKGCAGGGEAVAGLRILVSVVTALVGRSGCVALWGDVARSVKSAVLALREMSCDGGAVED